MCPDPNRSDPKNESTIPDTYKGESYWTPVEDILERYPPTEAKEIIWGLIESRGQDPNNLFRDIIRQDRIEMELLDWARHTDSELYSRIVKKCVERLVEHAKKNPVPINELFKSPVVLRDLIDEVDGFRSLVSKAARAFAKVAPEKFLFDIYGYMSTEDDGPYEELKNLLENYEELEAIALRGFIDLLKKAPRDPEMTKQIADLFRANVVQNYPEIEKEAAAFLYELSEDEFKKLGLDRQYPEFVKE